MAKLVIALKRGTSKGVFAAPVGIAAMVTDPGEEALLACEQPFSASQGEKAKIAYQRAILTCQQAYFDLFAANQPMRVNEEAYKKGIVLCKEARLAMDELDKALKNETGMVFGMNKSMGNDVTEKAREVKDAAVKKVTETVEKVKAVIKEKIEKLEVRTPSSSGGVRG